MKIVAGYLFIGLGIVDVGLSWIGIDLYWEIGINLPDWLYRWTAWIALVIGFAIFGISKKVNEEEEEV